MIPKFSAYWQVINNHLLVKFSDFAFISFLYFLLYYVHPTRCTTRFGVVCRCGHLTTGGARRKASLTRGYRSITPIWRQFLCSSLMFNVERLKWVEWQIKVYADEKVFVMDCDSNVSFDGFMERWWNSENHRELQLI